MINTEKPTVVDEDDLLMKADSMKAKPIWHWIIRKSFIPDILKIEFYQKECYAQLKIRSLISEQRNLPYLIGKERTK